MARDEHVRYRVVDGVATVTFNRPEKRNAITFAMVDAFSEHLARAAADPLVRAVVLDGAGTTFTAGVDVGERPDLQDPSRTTLEEDEAQILASAARWSELWSIPKPVIVKARGHCVGWGLEIALYADFVVATLDCQFFFPSVRNGSGLPDSSMALYHLGPQWSKRLLFTGDAIDGRTAARIGLVLDAVPDADLDGVRRRPRRPDGRGPTRADRPEQAGFEPRHRPDGTGSASGVRGPRQRRRPTESRCRPVEQAHPGPRAPRGDRVERPEPLALGGNPRSEVRRPLLHEGPGALCHLRRVDEPAGQLGAVLQRRPLQVEQVRQ